MNAICNNYLMNTRASILPLAYGRCMVIIATILCTCPAVQAQSFKADVHNVHKAYERSYRMHMEARVVYNSPEVQDDWYRGHIAVDKDNYLGSFEQQVSLKNERCWLVVDHQNQKVVYRKPSEEETAPAAPIDLDYVLDSLLGIEGKITLIESAGTERTYRISDLPMQDFYESVDLTLDNRGAINRIVYHYALVSWLAPSRVEVTFSDIVFGEGTPESEFSEAEYVLVNNNGVSLTEKFKDYELINLMDLPTR